MSDHFHDICDLVCRDDTSSLRFCTNLCGKVIFVRLEDSCLMQTYRRRVKVHVEENRVGILHPGR